MLLGKRSLIFFVRVPFRAEGYIQLGVFPIFLENDILKVDKVLGLTFFKVRKELEGFNTAQYTVAEFCARWIVFNSRVFA